LDKEALMGRRSLAVLGMCLLVVAAMGAEAQQLDEFVNAKAYCVMDAETGKVLSSLNPQLMLPPASTLKVGTALVAVNSLRLTDRVPISCHASQAPPSKINVKPGENYSVQDILYAVLLASANDASRALAEKVSGSEEQFACFMTSRLRQMGAYRTNFETASGLPEPGQYTTAYDLALIFRKAMENPTLAKIMSSKNYMLENGKEVRNHNRFLFSTDYAVAGKTGWTRSSQHTYVGMFQNGEKRIIISLLGSPNKWPDLRILIAKGFSEMGAPIAALPPLEEKLRRTGNGYTLAGDGYSRPARVRSKCRPRSRSYLRESSSNRELVRAGMASGGGRAGATGHKKKTAKGKAKTSTCSTRS
jgi:serine-type D-Ala-D-Ala carboxypeptidase (penicillin-binding protein 5/6)